MPRRLTCGSCGFPCAPSDEVACHGSAQRREEGGKEKPARGGRARLSAVRRAPLGRNPGRLQRRQRQLQRRARSSCLEMDDDSAGNGVQSDAFICPLLARTRYAPSKRLAASLYPRTPWKVPQKFSGDARYAASRAAGRAGRAPATPGRVAHPGLLPSSVPSLLPLQTGVRSRRSHTYKTSRTAQHSQTKVTRKFAVLTHVAGAPLRPLPSLCVLRIRGRADARADAQHARCSASDVFMPAHHVRR